MTASFKRSPAPLAWVVAAIAAGSSGHAGAQQRLTPEMQALMQACRPDYATHCSGVQPGGGRVIACLRAQEPGRLTPACREALPRIAALRPGASAAGAMPR
jgi:hypothetical protein